MSTLSIVKAGRPPRILTWHVHANYLYALSHAPAEFVVPVRPGNPPGYGDIGCKIPWGANVSTVSADCLKGEIFDGIVYQSADTYAERVGLLSAEQLALPCAYIEHNPPLPHPTDTVHPFNHPDGVLVHVTHYNAAYWSHGDVAVRVIEHGVPIAPGAVYTGELARGVAVVNHLDRRGRRVGADIYHRACQRVPIDLIGMEAESAGGLGEIDNTAVGTFMGRYRFYYSPNLYTSLGLSLVEAMHVGMPIVGMAATELPSVITNGVEGYVSLREEDVIDVMQQLIAEPALAAEWGCAARETARRRFALDRFTADWMSIFDAWVKT